MAEIYKKIWSVAIERVTWRQTWRLILLTVYGEEHLKNSYYGNFIGALTLSEGQINYLAKRKILNPFKLVKLILITISYSLDWMMDLDRNEDDSFIKFFVKMIKITIIDLPISIINRFLSPANMLIRPFRNLYVGSRKSTLAVIFILFCIASLFALGLVYWGSPFISMVGGALIFIPVKAMGMTISATMLATLTMVSDALIVMMLTAKSISLVDSSNKKISHLLFNSKKDTKNDFKLGIMNGTSVLFSFFGGDPEAPVKTKVETAQDGINFFLGVASSAATITTDTLTTLTNGVSAVVGNSSSVATKTHHIASSIPVFGSSMACYTGPAATLAAQGAAVANVVNTAVKITNKGVRKLIERTKYPEKTAQIIKLKFS